MWAEHLHKLLRVFSGKAMGVKLKRLPEFAKIIQANRQQMEIHEAPSKLEDGHKKVCIRESKYA